MDLSWVKQLADEANQTELARQEKVRREKEEERQVALATVPFVEKLYLYLAACIEEFNNHCMFPHLRVAASKLTKRQRTPEDIRYPADECAYFSFLCQGYLFGIRGNNGLVDFLEIPVGEAANALSIKLDEQGVQPSRELVAKVDPQSGSVIWTLDGAVLGGPTLISLCQQYFREFIEQSAERS